MAFAEAIAERWMACRLDLGTLTVIALGTSTYPTRMAATSECFVAVDAEATAIGDAANIFLKPTVDTCTAVQPYATWDGRDVMLLHRVTPEKEADGFFTPGAKTLRSEPVAKFFVLKVPAAAPPKPIEVVEATTEIEVNVDGEWIKASQLELGTAAKAEFRAEMPSISEEVPFPEAESATIATGGGWDDVVAEFKERLRVKRRCEEAHRLKAERRAERTLRRRDRRKTKAE